MLVDTREESEWARGRIPGAIHLSKGIIERDIEKTVLDKDTVVVLYCPEADFAPPSRRTTFRKWATETSFQWMAAGEP